jgi:hypothetical protein
MGAPPHTPVNFYEGLKSGTWNACQEMKGIIEKATWYGKTMACFYHALKTQENGKTESGFNMNGVIKEL